MLRKLLENITGVATGSEDPTKMYLASSLQYYGFKGQQILTDKVWITKTHHPFFPWPQFRSNAVMIAVRDPLDVIVSNFMMKGTISHVLTSQNSINKGELLPYWNTHFKNYIGLWKNWHEYWLNQAKTSSVPIFFCRFEDLINQK